MDNNSSKKIILWISLIFVTILTIVGFTYAFFNYSRTASVSNTIEVGTMMLGYIEQTNGIRLTNAMPITDEAALNTTDEDAYFDFYVKYNISRNATLTYEIDIEDVTGNLDNVVNGTLTKLDSKRVKVALEDRTVVAPSLPLVVGPTYFSQLEATPSSNSKNGYFLYSKSVTGDDTDYYRLYLWIPENDANGVGIPLIDIDDVEGIKNQAFSVRINVQALAKTNY